MAIYSFNISVVQRSKGQNVVAKAAYICRACFVNEATGDRYDFRRNGNATFSEILIPKNAPE